MMQSSSSTLSFDTTDTCRCGELNLLLSLQRLPSLEKERCLSGRATKRSETKPFTQPLQRFRFLFRGRTDDRHRGMPFARGCLETLADRALPTCRTVLFFLSNFK